MIKNVKLVELNRSLATVFFEYTNFKDDLTEYKYAYALTRIVNKSLMTSQKNNILIHINFLTMITINLFIVAKKCLSL